MNRLILWQVVWVEMDGPWRFTTCALLHLPEGNGRSLSLEVTLAIIKFFSNQCCRIFPFRGFFKETFRIWSQIFILDDRHRHFFKLTLIFHIVQILGTQNATTHHTDRWTVGLLLFFVYNHSLPNILQIHRPDLLHVLAGRNIWLNILLIWDILGHFNLEVLGFGHRKWFLLMKVLYIHIFDNIRPVGAFGITFHRLSLDWGAGYGNWHITECLIEFSPPLKFNLRWILFSIFKFVFDELFKEYF